MGLRAPDAHAEHPPGRLEGDCRGNRNASEAISAGLAAPVASRIAVLHSEIQLTLENENIILSVNNQFIRYNYRIDICGTLS
jgi:hypothetical protein